MKVILYYFSGTGNSYYVARRFSEMHGDAKVRHISHFFSSRQSLKDTQVGLFFPIHMMSAPKQVLKLAADITDPLYIFTFCTCGISKGIAHRQVELTLKRKEGLDACFTLKMPDGSKTETEAKSMISQTDTYIKYAVDLVSKEKKTTGNRGSIVLYALANPLFTFMLRMIGTKIGDKITVTDRCIGCGSCVSRCPAQNITISGGTALHGHSCDLCFGCVQWCTQKAVEGGLKDHKHYTNPHVQANEMRL